MRHFRHHIGDYTAATAHLSMLEDGAYRRLLDVYYQHERALPREISEVLRLCRATQKWEKRAVESVLKEFFRLESDGWHQSRADQEINIYKGQANRGRTNGVNGGRPRQEADEDTPVERQPITNNQEPITISEAKASAPDVASIVFNQTREWLVANSGRSDQECRKLIGRWRKSVTDGDIIGAVGAAQRAGAVDPIGYIEGVFRTTKKAGAARPPMQM